MGLLRRLLRSPHILEVFGTYGMGLIICMSLCFLVHGMSITEWIFWTMVGTSIYTFLEYVFHRFLLHITMKPLHDRHHHTPRNFRIIATPLIPVHLVDLVLCTTLYFLLGRQIACGINCGIAVGQMIMDMVHVILHTRNCPWYLSTARSYHYYHHFDTKGDDTAIGLTTTFWDMLFGTLPSHWQLYRKHPWLRFIQIPLPLLTFVIMAFMTVEPTGKKTRSRTRAVDGQVTSPKSSQDYGVLKPLQMFSSTVLSTWLLVFAWFEML